MQEIQRTEDYVELHHVANQQVHGCKLIFVYLISKVQTVRKFTGLGKLQPGFFKRYIVRKGKDYKGNLHILRVLKDTLNLKNCHD